MPTPNTHDEQQFQTSKVVSLSTVHAVHDTYAAFLPPLLPLFIANLGLSRAEAGMLTVFTQAPSVIQPFVGHASDKRNLNFWIFLAPALAAALMSGLTLMPSYTALAVLLTAVGISSAAFHAIGPVITGRMAGTRLGKAMSFWMVGGELGRTIGPIVIVTAIAHLAPSKVPWIMLAGIAASILLFLKLRHLPSSHQGASSTLPWKIALRKMGPILLPISGIIIVRAFLISGLTTYLPTFLTDEGESLWMAGAALTLVQAAGVSGAMIAGSLSDRLGRKKVLRLLMITAPILTILFLHTDGWLRLPLLLGMGFSVISTTPVVMALVQENFPENRALANGIYMCLSFLIRSIAILAVGLAGDSFGLKTALAISAGIMAFGSLLVTTLPTEKNKSS
ncbi:MFS transporter [bacterium]|nr:MFS transporter [bacterium]